MAMELVRNLPYNHPYRWDGTLFGGPKLWRPTEISTALWLDAEDSSTITLNGSTVSQWSDKSGNGRHATQSTAASQPTYSATGLNSKPTLVFNGNQIVVSSGSYSAAAIFIVFRKSVSTWPDYNGVVTARVSPNANKTSPSNTNLGFTGISGSAASINGLNTATTAIFINGTSASLSDYLNYLVGVSTGDATSYAIVAEINDNNASGQKNIALGADTFETGRYLTGNIAEVIILPSNVITSDRQKLEGYLAWKWGLESSLPAGHPYKNLPPTV
jgi:hypothetical protein